MSEYSSYMWSVPDWRTDEMFLLLDNREAGIYRHLIDECWVSRSIPSNPEELAKMCREPADYFTVVWSKIGIKFRPLGDGKRLISTRLEQDRRRLMLTAKFNEKRAKKAAKVRWAKSNAEKELHATSTFVASTEHAVEQCQIQIQTQKESGSLLEDSPNTETSTVLKHRGERVQKTRAPAEFPITDSMLRWAEENGLAHFNLQQEAEAMLDHFRGKGEARQDWTATWRAWMRNTKKFNRSGNGKSNGQPKEHYQDRVARENRETAALIDQQLFGSTGNSAGPEDPGGPNRALLPRPK